MANENLKDALRTAGLTSEQFAQIIDVDPKTVQRWVSGRTPYPRHRATIARALDLTEHDLWPDDVPPPADVSAPAGPTAPGGDVIGSWGKLTDAGAPDLVAFISNAVSQVDLLDDGRGLLRTPGLLEALDERSRSGCRVRAITYTPGRELRQLIGNEQIEPFTVEPPAAHALIRVGDQMLVTLSFPHATDQPPPLLHLRRQVEGGLFERLTEHFQLLADHAGTIPTVGQPTDAPQADNDQDRDERRDMDHRAPAVEPSKPARGRGSSTGEPDTPRRWPRRAT